MKLRPFAFLLLALAGPGGAPAAELVDLGPRLSYLRAPSAAEAAETLATALTAERSLVLDLRYVRAGEDEVRTLRAALARRHPRALVLILVSPATPAALEPALAPLPAGMLTLGVAGSRPAPTIVVAQPADVDRRAFEALDGGMKLEDLITGRIDKERFDEASLVKEFQNGNGNAAPPPAPDITRPAPEQAPVLTDRVLQRAIHLHRALAALTPTSR
jgi:hypothetical protein